MTTCYRDLANNLYNVSDSDIPCSSTNPTGCCVYGDYCLSNGICHYTHSTSGGSGYYLQSSTDDTFKSTIGQETFHCTGLDYPDIVYNNATGLWTCCSSGTSTGPQCSDPTTETWSAPAPALLSTLTSIMQSPSAASASTLPANSTTNIGFLNSTILTTTTASSSSNLFTSPSSSVLPTTPTSSAATTTSLPPSSAVATSNAASASASSSSSSASPISPANSIALLGIMFWAVTGLRSR